MDDGSNPLDETARAALPPLEGRRDARLEQRLGYLAGEQARLKGSPSLRRFLRGAVAAYRRFLLTADPAHRFHCWATLHAVSAGLERLECGRADHQAASSAPDGADPVPALAGLMDRVH